MAAGGDEHKGKEPVSGRSSKRMRAGGGNPQSRAARRPHAAERTVPAPGHTRCARPWSPVTSHWLFGLSDKPRDVPSAWPRPPSRR